MAGSNRKETANSKNRKQQSRKDKKVEKRRAKISGRREEERIDRIKAAERAAEAARYEQLKAEEAAERKARKKAEKKSRKNYRAPVTASNRSRLAAGFFVLLLAMCALIIRMGYWQIYKSEELRVMAADMQKVDTEIDPVRGSIYDSRMSTLAESVTEYELYAYTQPLYKADNVSREDKAAAVNRMASVTGKEHQEILDLFEGTENLVLIAEGLTRDQVERAEKLFGTNVVVKTRVARYYPNGPFAAQVLGGVNADNVGRSGLEYEYNSTLAGIKGRTVRTTDNNGNTLPDGRSRYYKAQDGNSVVTTIDSVIQHFVEDALETGMDRNGAEAITCIVMEPKTGNILAMAQTPEYDPNNSSEPAGKEEKKTFEKMNDAQQTDYLSEMWKIKSVSDVYEPGSTFKLIAAAAALESGNADKKSRYTCNGYIRVDDYTLHCLQNHGTQTLKQAVGNSCNPALAQVALDMGAGTFYNYIDLFGFNDQTGVDLPGEGYSIVKDPIGMSRVDLATTGYGQGIAVTPLQILCAVNSFATDGVLMKPKIVKKIVDKEGNTVEEFGDTAVRQVVSENTAEKMRDIMEYYVSDAGGTTAYIPGYRVGGKTGTANRVSGRTYSAATNTSFVAMAPMDDPVISMICIVYRPTKQQYGAFTAGPIVKEITEKSLEYLGVERKYSKQEEKETKKSLVKVPDVTDMDSLDAMAALRAAGLKYTVMPESAEDRSFVVVDQYPKAGSGVEKDSTVYLYSE
ncbi:MAG: PASTA domain-containing protein [Mogibacterium sp.]|nr:PASTA domain-containing protein [Mogibacterium sp.]